MKYVTYRLPLARRFIGLWRSELFGDWQMTSNRASSAVALAMAAFLKGFIPLTHGKRSAPTRAALYEVR